MNKSNVKEADKLYFEIDRCIFKLVNARLNNSIVDEQSALSQMELLMVQVQQFLSYAGTKEPISDEKLTMIVRQLPGVHTYDKDGNWITTREDAITDAIRLVLEDYNSGELS